MKKYIISSVILIIISIAALYFIKAPKKYNKEETISLAIVSPADEIIGKEMVNGASLYINKINRKGGLFNKKINLIVFDDMGKSKKATNIALKISENNQILGVLGHSNNESSIAAGRIYKKIGIPAIAGSATSELVTRDNEWYFRIIPNDEFQAKFIAHYVYRSLKIPSACVIYDSDDYGKILSSTFVTEANKIGLNIKHLWQLNSSSENISKEIKNILVSLRSIDNPGILFLAVHASQASDIITSIHYPKTKLKIIGTYELTRPSFIKTISKNVLEQNVPGFFSDGIYAIMPYMSDLSDKTGIEFLNNYLTAYSEMPTWIAASHYDAAHLLTQAIKKAGIHNTAIGKQRMNIKDALQTMFHIDYAVKGTLGHFYFNNDGDVKAPVEAAKLYKQTFIPTFSQYRLNLDKNLSNDMGTQIIKGEKIVIDDIIMNKTQIVYTGIHVNKIENLNIIKQFCTFDFFIWFKYKGLFKPENIIFENALSPIKLEKPVIEKYSDINICSFHVKADFQNYFNFRNYPFDDQILKINYRHKTKTDDKLIFVIDRENKKIPLDKSKITDPKINLSTGWKLDKEYIFQDIMTHESRIGTKQSDIKTDAQYSKVNYRVRINRTEWSSIIRKFFPVCAIFILIIIIRFLPPHNINIKIITIVGGLITNAIYHINFISTHNIVYLTTIDYIYIGLYIVLIFTAINSVFFYILHTKNAQKMIKYLRIATGIIYVFIVSGIGYYTYEFFEQTIQKEIWSGFYKI